jgi:hypothetical protein
MLSLIDLPYEIYLEIAKNMTMTDVLYFQEALGINVFKHMHFSETCINHSVVIASMKGNANLLRLLLKNGADVHAHNDAALKWASESGHTEVVKILIDYGANIHVQNDYALRWSSVNGYFDIVTALLEHGADVHAGNDAALWWAQSNGYTSTVKVLLAYGADATVLRC